MTERKHFTPEQITYAKSKMAREGFSWTGLARELGCDRKTIQLAIAENIFGAVSTDIRKLNISRSARASNDLLKARDARISAPHRDLSGMLFGDPRVGQSALDRKMEAA